MDRVSPPHVWDGETQSARSWRNQEVIALNPRQFRERWLNEAMPFVERVASARFQGSGRSQAADFEVQTLQVEAMKSGGWVAEREEAEEEEEEIQSSRGHCPYSDSPLLLHAPLLMKDIALSVGEVEREGGGQFWMD